MGVRVSFLNDVPTGETVRGQILSKQEASLDRLLPNWSFELESGQTFTNEGKGPMSKIRKHTTHTTPGPRDCAANTLETHTQTHSRRRGWEEIPGRFLLNAPAIISC